MNDIQTREDVHLIMIEFYMKLVAESKISYLFIEATKIVLSPDLLKSISLFGVKFFLKLEYRKNIFLFKI